MLLNVFFRKNLVICVFNDAEKIRIFSVRVKSFVQFIDRMFETDQMTMIYPKWPLYTIRHSTWCIIFGIKST